MAPAGLKGRSGKCWRQQNIT